MKSIIKKVVFNIFLISLLLVVGCNTIGKKNNLEEQAEYKIYMQAISTGYEGTYEEWLASIQGEDGKDGIDGISIIDVSINTNGELEITYSTGKVVNIGKVVGKDGAPGEDGKDGAPGEDGKDGTPGEDGKDGTPGEDGVGITNIFINEVGELIINLSDETTKNLGKVAGGINDDTIHEVTLKNGTNVINTLDIEFGNNIPNQEPLNEEGKQFLGWYYGEDKWRFNLDVVTKDITLEAKWEEPSEVEEMVVPVYQGMTAESTKEVQGRNQNTKKAKSAFGDEITDYLDIETTEAVEYYATKGEKFNILVHLYNPSSFEILSFTLNNYKYQSFEFKEGSNSNTLIIEVDAGLVAGLKEYTIDAIKYIDKTEIKDVQMDGKKTIKAGIKYDVVPNASIIKEEIETTSYKSIIEVKDETKLMNQTNGIYFFVYDGKSIIVNQKMTLGVNNIEVNNLSMGTNYEYMVIGVYDDYSGAGKRAVGLISNTITTLDGYLVKSISSSKNSIDIELENNDTNATLSKVNLYLNDLLIESLEENNIVNFSNLLSNTTYEVELEYEYIKNNIKITKTIEIEKKTQEKQEPTFGLVSIESTKDSISYEINENDIDQVKCGLEVVLSSNGNEIARNSTLKGVFDKLLSNTTYEVKVEYKYNLNDGLGDRTSTKEEHQKTLAYQVPEVGIKTKTTLDTIEYELSIVDIDNIIRISNVKLYKEQVLIASKNTIKDTFSNLSPNTKYQIVVDYQYDLNDGTGIINKSKEIELITNKQIPEILIEAYNITQTSINYDLLINDPNSLGSISSIRLYKNNSYIKQMNQFDTSITDLTYNTAYQIIVIYTYDLNDGSGSKQINYQYDFKTIKQEPIVSLSSNNITNNSFDIAYMINDVDNTLTFEKINLKHNNEIVNEYNTKTTSFTSLLSNNEYSVEVVWNCDLNNNTVYKITRTLNVTTLSKANPNVNINLNSTKNTIEYSYEISDIDNISTFKQIEIYRNNELVNIVPTNNKFTNLLSNNEYEIRITLSCDYNDGLGLVDRVYKSSIYTQPLSNPNYNIDFISTQEKIEGNVDVIDNDLTIVEQTLDVYKEDKLIKNIELTNEFSIDSLESNTLYTFKVKYSYNLNDGAGNVLNELDFSYSTLAYEVSISSHLLLNTDSIKTDENINLQFNLNNQSQITILKVSINNKEIEVSGGNEKDNIIIIFDSGKVSGQNEYKINYFVYELNGILIKQQLTEEYAVSIDISSRLNILSISTLNASNIVKKSFGTGMVVKIDNPEGYVVDSCILEINGSRKEYNDIEMIDNNHFYLPHYISSSGVTSYKVYSISYHKDSNNLVRNYNETFKVSVTALNVDSSTKSLVINQISTPEDLLSIQSGKAYELANDIDMTGYKWVIKDFNGYLDGKGHKISNLNVIVENEYEYTQYYGLFNSLSGTIQNILFDNLFYSIQTKGYVNIKVLAANMNATYSGIVVNGAMNVSATSYGFSIESNIVILDSFKINNQNVTTNEVILSKDFTTEYKENNLGWKFIQKQYETYGDYEYYIIDESYIIISKYDGNSETLEIPSEIEGLPVVGIDDFAFLDCLSISKLAIPSNMLYIGGGAFQGCLNINDLSIPAKLFSNNQIDLLKLKRIEITGKGLKWISGFNGSKVLEEVILPEGVTSISSDAFKGCEKLASINIPDTVTSIGSSAFSGCEKLTSINIPDTVTSIGREAFYNCRSLTSINIPDTVTSIDYGTFSNCSSLTNINIPDTVTSIRESAFYYCSSLTSINIPEGITSIGIYVFSGCSSLTSINIPDTVTSIGNGAFQSCISLTSINIPEGVTSIGNGAFYGCEKLTSINIPEGVTSIESNTFYNCSSLTSINIPDTVTSIGDWTFSSCSSLTSINIPDTVTSIGDYAFNGCYSLTIYCEVSSKPDEWDQKWNNSNRLVIWNYSE